MDNLIIFDGVCKLCAHTVRFVVRHESAPVLKFAPLQSETGSRLMRELGLDPEDAETFVLISDGAAFVRSDAAIELANYLSGGWRALGWVRIIPRPLRDWCYALVARNRYRWFGRTEACMVPPAEISARFVDD